jgi:hypothetical protein
MYFINSLICSDFPKKKKKKKEIKAAMGLAIMCYYFRVNRSPRDKGCLLRFNI